MARRSFDDADYDDWKEEEREREQRKGRPRPERTRHEPDPEGGRGRRPGEPGGHERPGREEDRRPPSW